MLDHGQARADVLTDKHHVGELKFLVRILATAACYYLATRTAWVLCFPDSKVSLFFPPHAVLVSILLLVPTRQWCAYVLAAACSHYFATQQDHWPPLYALHCEVFDAVQNVLVAAGMRMFIKSPFHLISLREAIIFVLIAVIIVPVGAAFWGAAFTLSNGFGTHYWIEWRNLSISNGVTAIVLVPAILLGVHQLFTKGFKAPPRRILEACFLAVGLLAVAYVAFDRLPAGPDTSPALLYAPIPLLIWAAVRFGLGGISASMLVITMLAIWGTMQGRGPFLAQSPVENAVALQLFLLMAATPLTLLAVAIDDERRSKEALRLQREELAHLSRVATVSALSSSLAHELSQPLSSILTNAQAGEQVMLQDPPDVGELRAILADIVSEDRRAGEIIGRLRTMLRRGEVSRQPVSVNECLEELLRLPQRSHCARCHRLESHSRRLALGDDGSRATPADSPQPDHERLRRHGIESTRSPQAHAHDLHRAQRTAHRRAGLRSRFAGGRGDLVPAVPHHQG